MRVNAQERDRFRAAVGGVRDSMERDYLSNGLQVITISLQKWEAGQTFYVFPMVLGDEIFFVRLTGYTGRWDGPNG